MDSLCWRPSPRLRTPAILFLFPDGPQAIHSFSEGWLPESDAHQNLFQLKDEFGIGIILTYKGSKSLVEESVYLAHKKSRELVPKPPKIQELLKLAISLKQRFQREPGCTRLQAAQDLGISERRLYQIMRLLKLDTKKQHEILSLSSTLGRGIITERQLRHP